MPFVSVTAEAGQLSDDAKQTLISRLSDAVIRAEGASPADAGPQAMTWGHIHELPRGNLFVYGEVKSQTPLHIAFTTPEGLLTEASRAQLCAEVNDAVNDILGEIEGGMNHWVIITEVPSGKWGAMGQVFQTEAIKGILNVA
ncbi:MAG: tautomerase family protein [Pseudomonadota bacterium]